MKTNIKKRALTLRRSGRSFREISLALDISKSTASLWTRHAHLSEVAKRRLIQLGDDGRRRALETIRRKQQKILAEISASCSVLKGKHYDRDDFKLFLALLYWGEGTKSRSNMAFMNSDPKMIKTYLLFLRKAFKTDIGRFRARIHLHDYHNRRKMIDFWSKVTGIPKNLFSIYNKPHTGINKKPGYKGCLSIRYGDSRILKEIFIIIDRLARIRK